ncbi:MAG TPA: thymidine kinase [Nitrososphaerales archaeon]|nr:thymidine kinase [Nitrososphaerales archaeon]HUK74156.1 thymidine kinase [Nitrososphaerales archaeon]
MTLEVIIGPMFSGKTSELIRLVEREVYAKRKGAIFKPSFDKRYSVKDVVTHNGLHYAAYLIHASEDGIEKIPRLVSKGKIDVVGIDEVQFFPDKIVRLLDDLASEKLVIACGLNMSFKAEPFANTMELAARADRVRYLSAVCVVCGSEATRTQRLIGGKPAPKDSPTIVVGGKEIYEPRCRSCYEPPP